VRVTPATTGSVVSNRLRLGLDNGGYETRPHHEFSDQELGILLDDAINHFNVTQFVSWTYSTIPANAETIIIYKAWSLVVDIKIGRSTGLFSNQVESTITHEEQVFSNLMKLADWLRKSLEDKENEVFGSSAETGTVTRWDSASNTFVGQGDYVSQNLSYKLLSVTNGSVAGEVMLELDLIRVSNLYEIYIGHSTQSPVISQHVFTEANYDTAYAARKGFESPAVLARTLRSGKNTMVKLTGLAPGLHYFAMQVVDTQGNRYFSNELSLEVPA
jgi:hypothetical protein